MGFGMSSSVVAKSESPGREPVSVSTNIECGNGDARLEPDGIVHLTPIRGAADEPADLSGAGYNLCVQFSNPTTESLRVPIVVEMGDWFEEEWCRLPLRLPYWKRTPAEARAWTEADPGQFNTRDQVHLTLELPPRQSALVSTIPHCGFSECTRVLTKWANEMPRQCRLTEVGKSVGGRAILALAIGNPTGRAIAIVGSSRACEPSAWGILAMIPRLLESSPWSDSLESYQIHLVPQPNPDAIAEGTCPGRPFGKDWSRVLDEPRGEAAMLWRYLEAQRPVLVGQFEFAPATTRLSDWPRPLAVDMYNRISVAIHDRLAELSGSGGQYAKDRRDPPRQQLAHHAARNWNCAAFAYRYVGPTATPARAEHRARRVLDIVLQTLRDES